MAIKIGSNIASLNAQRRLAEAGTDLSKTFEKLSSGQRINRASDDAAGLAIADDLKAKGRIYTQAIRNGNDGISLLNIADSAIDALTSVVVRIRELSEQSANGTYSSKQRAALDSEAQQLSKEFTRIAQTTSFNGLKVFDGSMATGVRLQLGLGNSESINASIGGAIGTGSFGALTTYSVSQFTSTDISITDINSDGFLDMITAGGTAADGYATISLGNGDGTFGTQTFYTTESGRTDGLSIADINNDGIMDLVTSGVIDSLAGFASVRLGSGNGSFGSLLSYSMSYFDSNDVSVGDINSDGNLDLVSVGADALGFGSAAIRLGNGDGTFGAQRLYTTERYSSISVSLGDINEDGKLDLVTAGGGGSGGAATIRLGNGDGTFGTLTTYDTIGNQSLSVQLGDINGDSHLDLVTSEWHDSYSGYATVRLGSGNGTFGAATSYTADGMFSYDVALGDLSGDGILDLVSAGYGSGGGSATIRIGNGNGTFGAALTYSTEEVTSYGLSLSDLNNDGVLDLATTGVAAPSGGRSSIRLASTKEGLGALQEFSLKSRPNSLQAMQMLDKSLQNLAMQRGTIGASQSRINIALNNIQTTKENFNAAESRIRDADISQESANLIRTQILQQAASAILSQANQSPSLALTLLR